MLRRMTIGVSSAGKPCRKVDFKPLEATARPAAGSVLDPSFVSRVLFAISRIAKQDARNDAGDEQIGDRDVHLHRIDDEHDRRRDQRIHQRSGNHQRGREFGAVAGIAHRVDRDDAEARDGGERRARDAAEHHRGEHRDLREPAARNSQRRLRGNRRCACVMPNWFIRLPASTKNGIASSGTDAHVGRHVAHQRVERHVEHHEPGDRRQPHRGADRHAQRHQREQHDDHQRRRHGATPSAPADGCAAQAV